MRDIAIYEPVVILKPEKVSFGEGCRVDSFVKIEGGEGVSFGQGVHVSSFAHINVGGGKVTVGNFTALASGCIVFGGTNVSQGAAMSSAAPQEMQIVKREHTKIGARVMIGAGAIVMPGAEIGDCAVVGAGALVTGKVAAHAIVVGNPAKQVAWRFNTADPNRMCVAKVNEEVEV